MSRPKIGQVNTTSPSDARASVWHAHRYAEILGVSERHASNYAQREAAKLLRTHGVAAIQARQAVANAVSRFDDLFMDFSADGRTPNPALENKIYRIMRMMDHGKHVASVEHDIETMTGL